MFAALTIALLLAAVMAPGANADTPASVDVTSPVDGNTYNDSSNAPLLEFTNTGDVASQDCKYDHTAFRDCNDFAYPGLRLGNGSHSYTVRTTDTLGTVSFNTVNFTIDDTAAPTSSAAVAPNGDGNVENPVVSELALDLTTDDFHARVYGSIDNSAAVRLNADGPVLRWYPRHVSNAAHVATFLVVDGAGNASTTTVGFTTADNTAPTALIQSPTPSQLLATNEIAASFDSTEVNGSFTCQIDTTPEQHCAPSAVVTFTNLATGVHAFTVRGTDSAGNSGSSVATFTVTDAPVSGLTIAEPANGVTYTAQPLLKLNLGSPLTDFTLRCSINGGKFAYCADGEPLPGIDQNGAWTLTVQALKDTGEKVTDTSAFTVNDTTGPQVLASPPSGPIADVAGFVPNFSVSDQFADATGSNFTHATCGIDSQPAADCEQLLLDSSEPTYTSGAHTFKLTATDWSGNATTASMAFTISDVTAPVVSISSPISNQTITNGSFTVDFTAQGGAIKFECQINSDPRVPCGSGENDGVHSWSPPDVPTGSVTFHVYATDNAGNTGSASVSVNNSDVTGPALSFLSPGAGATVSDTVAAHVISDEQIFKLRCAVDGAALAADAVACSIDPNDRHTATFRPASLDSNPHTLWIEASDNHGNSTTISRAIVVNDTTAPELRILGFNVSDREPTFDSPSTFDYLSSDAAARFTCSLDGAAAVDCGSGGSGTFELAPTTNGDHSILVTAIDPSGNSTPKTTNYTVADSLAPYLWINDAVDGMAVGTSVVTHPQAAGETSLSCALDSQAFVACSSSGWTSVFASGGAHTLHYRAADAAGNTVTKNIKVVATVPATPDSPATDAPAPPPLPRATASIKKFKPKVAKKSVTIPVAVVVALPAGVNVAAACAGKATIVLTVGAKKLSSASAPLKLANGKCVIAKVLKLRTKAIAGKKFSVAVSFPGNSAIANFYGAKQGSAAKAT